MESLKGHLLIAGPGLVDPNFWRAVVLVGEHSEEGALGVVLNRSSETPVAEAVPELALLADDIGAVHVGGPVQPSAVVVLADFADASDAESLVLDTIGFLPSEVDPIALGELRRARVYVGYSGWGPGQLDERAGGRLLDRRARTRRGRLHERSGRALERRAPAQGRSLRRSRLDAPGPEPELSGRLGRA